MKFKFYVITVVTPLYGHPLISVTDRLICPYEKLIYLFYNLPA